MNLKYCRSFVAVIVLIVIYKHLETAAHLNELDDKLWMTLLNPAKTPEGNTLVEGDIVISLEDENDVEKWKALPNKGGLWTDKIIPYAFHESVTRSTKLVILAAIEEWENKTCVRFVPREEQTQYLQFRTDSPGCFTYVGRKHQGGQDVNLGPGCEHLQIAMHELGHSLGFFHEHSRKDRAAHVRILWQNVDRGLSSQFTPGNDNPRGVPYDLASLMHYSPMAFSNRIFEKNTMVSIDPHLQPLMGRSRGITFRDGKLANLLYSCDDNCSNKGTVLCENEGYLFSHAKESTECQCLCPPNAKGKRCERLVGDYYGPTECGGDMHHEGPLQTPGYPNREKGNGSCTWRIQAPVGKRVAVDFRDFSFRARIKKPDSPYDGLCVFEHVEIRTSSPDDGTMYCGEDIAPGTRLVSTSSTFLILIRADGAGEGRGLEAVVSHIQ